MAIDGADFALMFRAVAAQMETEKAHLCALDAVTGDADHGTAMAQGFQAVARSLDELDLSQATPADVLTAAARAFVYAVGASCGPLYAAAFTRAAAALSGRRTAAADDIVAALTAMADGIAERGGAQAGDKTMLDAWLPAVDALRRGFAADGELLPALQAASAHAAAGAEATREMAAAKGRSARLGERARGHVDPGAASAAMVIAVMAEHLRG